MAAQTKPWLITTCATISQERAITHSTVIDIEQAKDVRKQKDVGDLGECGEQPRHEDRREDGIVEDYVVLVPNREKGTDRRTRQRKFAQPG